LLFLISLTGLISAASVFAVHPIPIEHPRLLGSAERLQELAREKPDVFTRVVQVALEQEGGDHEKMISMALVSMRSKVTGGAVKHLWSRQWNISTGRSAPAWRVEVSPEIPSAADYFLHVLTATEPTRSRVPKATAESADNGFSVKLESAKLFLATENVGGWTETAGKRISFAGEIVK